MIRLEGKRINFKVLTRNVEPDSAEPFDPEPFGRELRVARLTAEGLVAG